MSNRITAAMNSNVSTNPSYGTSVEDGLPLGDSIATETTSLLSLMKSEQHATMGKTNDIRNSTNISSNSTNNSTYSTKSNHSNNSNNSSNAGLEIGTKFRSMPASSTPSRRRKRNSVDHNCLKVTKSKDRLEPPSAQEFYFPKPNTPACPTTKKPQRIVAVRPTVTHTVQRYYRFTSTPLHPIAALYKRPIPEYNAALRASGAGGSISSNTPNNNANITGLLRRSAVVPSHGTDATGNWILVSVGGRSGWARKKQHNPHFSLQHPNLLHRLQKHSTHTNQNNQEDDAASEFSSSATSFVSTAAPGGGDGSGTGYFTPAHTFRAMDAWMGNQSFYCNGKIMLGSDAPSLFLATFLIVFGCLVHFVSILPYMIKQQQTLVILSQEIDCDAKCASIAFFAAFYRHPTALSILSWILSSGSLFYLWIAAVMDPGIIPPASSPIKASIPIIPGTDPPQYVPIGGPNGYRYCSTCNIFRPPRSKHCNSCNVCVAVFDHHCPWVGNCIGQRNYGVFVVFLVFVSALCVLVTLCATCILVTEYKTYMHQLSHVEIKNEEQFSPSVHSHDNYNYTLFSEKTSNYTSLNIDLSVFDNNGTAKETTSFTTDVNEIEKYGHSSSHTLLHVLYQMPGTALFGLFCFATTWSVVPLVCYHFLIISVGQTTNERVRGVYRSNFGAATNNFISNNTSSGTTVVHNPADHGCCLNWYRCCKSICIPATVSKLPRDFSEMVHTDPSIVESPWNPTCATTSTSNSSNTNTIP